MSIAVVTGYKFHCKSRVRFRCKSTEWLLWYGESEKAARWAERLFFSKKSRKALSKDFGKPVVSRLSGLLDIYMIIKDGTVITVARQSKKFYRDFHPHDRRR